MVKLTIVYTGIEVLKCNYTQLQLISILSSSPHENMDEDTERM